jgi:hypothetical protein
MRMLLVNEFIINRIVEQNQLTLSLLTPGYRPRRVGTEWRVCGMPTRSGKVNQISRCLVRNLGLPGGGEPLKPL